MRASYQPVRAPVAHLRLGLAREGLLPHRLLLQEPDAVLEGLELAAQPRRRSPAGSASSFSLPIFRPHSRLYPR